MTDTFMAHSENLKLKETIYDELIRIGKENSYDQLTGLGLEGTEH